MIYSKIFRAARANYYELWRILLFMIFLQKFCLKTEWNVRLKCTVIYWKQYCVAKHFIQPTGIGARKRVTAQIWAVVLLPGDTFTSFTSHVHFIKFHKFHNWKVIICWFSNQKCKHIFWDSWAKLVFFVFEQKYMQRFWKIANSGLVQRKKM